MKNLRVSYENGVTDENTVALLTGALKMCVAANDELLFVVLRDGRIIAIDRNMKMVDEFTQFTTKVCREGPSELIGFDYLEDDQQLCLVLADGRLLTFSPSSKELNYVMELKRNIFGCSWSPEMHLLVIATDSHLLLVSREFHVVAEAPIRPTTAGKDQLLTIGWGSAETQFQGSAGRQNVHKQDQHRVPIPIREAFDDKRVIISWRDDSDFFIVSSVDEVVVPKQADSPSKNSHLDKMLCRQLRVWNSELAFMSQCEFLAGIEAAVCMGSNKNFIAVPAVVSNERHIWLYERNGQIRNKFKLFESNFDSVDGGELNKRSVVRHLACNLGGTVLYGGTMILMLCYEDILLKSFQLQFWTISNYSWTEKLRLSVGELADFFWDPADSNKFHYLTKSGVYRKIVFRSEYNCEDMIVVSINGDRVRVTDFKYAPIPPPMCHYELSLDFVGTPSAFAQSSAFGLALVSSDFTRISTFSLQNRRFIRAKNVSVDESLRLLLNLIWRDANTLLAFRKSELSGGAYELVELRLNPWAISSIGEFDHLPLAPPLLTDSSDSHLPNWGSDKENCVKIEPIKLSGDQCLLTLFKMEPTAQFGCDCLASKTIEMEGKGTLVFYLNSKEQLFVNGRLLHSTVSSFCCTKEFLSLVLFSCGFRLVCLPVALVQKFVADDDKQSITDVFECSGTGRDVEGCAGLIGSEPNGTRVWLQIPRGNLEVIHPRPILLEKLKCWLDAREWSKAFVEMRRHRIDLNLLYDHNPKVFIDNIGQFITQVNDAESLCVFLTSLETTDTTQKMFAPFYSERQPTNSNKQRTLETPGKMNGICDRIRAHLMSLSEAEGEMDRFLRLYPVILCCYVMEKPSRVSAALTNMCTQIAKVNKTGDEHCDLVRKWTNHLSNLIKEPDLFKQALKTYDVEIALMVVQATNLDPKEYLPALNDLKHKTPSTYQKYHIDLYIEDWNSALEHIAALAQLQQNDDNVDVADGVENDEGKCAKTTRAKISYLEECLKLVQQHKLYSSALKLFCGRPHYKEICEITAKELETNGRLKEAAILHEKAQDLSSAMRCHMVLSNFSEYCRLAQLQKQSAEKTESELRQMATQMTFKNDHLAAAEVFAHLGKEKNFEKILDCYEKANAWDKLVAFVNGDQCAAVQGIINKAQVLLSTRCAQIIEQIDSWRDTLTKHTKRLEVVREEKRDKIEAIGLARQAKADADNNKSDAISEASFTYSSFSDTDSLKSRGTSAYMEFHNFRPSEEVKARLMARKHDKRNKEVIKEGSPWEDGAILVALKDIYQRINAQQDELVELLPALLSMDLVERACRLQNEMLTFLKFVADNHTQIWPFYLEAFHLPGPLNKLYRLSKPADPIPRKIQLDDELVPPKLRSTGAEWKLGIIE